MDRVVTQGIVDIELGSEAGQDLNSLNDTETADGNSKSHWKGEGECYLEMTAFCCFMRWAASFAIQGIRVGFGTQ